MGPGLDLLPFQPLQQVEQCPWRETVPIAPRRILETFLQLLCVRYQRDGWIAVKNELNIAAVNRILIDGLGRGLRSRGVVDAC